MRFVKAHGTGNAFVLLPDPDGASVLTAELTRALCHPHTGLGGDGVIRLAPARPGTDASVFMDYRNADGSVAEMCGNGVRCVAKFLFDEGAEPGPIRVDTRAGVKPVAITATNRGGAASRARVGLGVARVAGEPVSAASTGGTVTATALSLGNPHAVVVDDVDAVDLEALASAFAAHAAFPDGVNVEVVAAGAEGARARIRERGSGETAASGTGAAAAVVAGARHGVCADATWLELPGGWVFVDASGDEVTLEGRVTEVARGELSPELSPATGAAATPAAEMEGAV